LLGGSEFLTTSAQGFTDYLNYQIQNGITRRRRSLLSDNRVYSATNRTTLALRIDQNASSQPSTPRAPSQKGASLSTVLNSHLGDEGDGPPQRILQAAIRPLGAPGLDTLTPATAAAPEFQKTEGPENPRIALESKLHSLFTDIGHLAVDVADTSKFMRASLAAALQDHAFLPNIFVPPKQSAFVLEVGVSAIAQAVLAAQERG
jgi:hypothetical protein